VWGSDGRPLLELAIGLLASRHLASDSASRVGVRARLHATCLVTLVGIDRHL
jgi:hypothetical protein